MKFESLLFRKLCFYPFQNILNTSNFSSKNRKMLFLEKIEEYIFNIHRFKVRGVEQNIVKMN